MACTARHWSSVAGMLCLAACAGGPRADTTPRNVTLDWPELGGKVLPQVGGGEADAVVIVAIEHYSDLAPVTGALKSADDWSDYFTRVLRVPASRVYVEKVQVTALKMRTAVERARAQVKGRGRLWFVFIGHGAPVVSAGGSQLSASDGLLVDSRALADELTGLKHSELMELVRPASKSGRAPILILDACYSGKVAAADGAGVQSLTGAAMGPLKFEPATASNVITFSAAASDQAAYPLPGAAARRPAFSYLMIGGLRGWADVEGDGDGAVSAEEVIAFTRTALQRLGRQQTPQLSGRVSAPLVRAGDVPRVDFRAYANRLAGHASEVVPARDESVEPSDAEDEGAPAPRSPCLLGFRETSTGCSPDDGGTRAVRAPAPWPDARSESALEDAVERAEDALDDVERRDPRRPALLLTLAETRAAFALVAEDSSERRDRIEAAIAAYSQLIEQHADFAQTDRALAGLAWLLDEIRAPGDRAREVYARLMKNYPESTYRADAYFRLASEYFEAGDMKAASLFYGNAAAVPLKRNRSYGHARYMLARVRYIQGDAEGSLEELTKSLEFGKQNPAIPNIREIVRLSRLALVPAYAQAKDPKKALAFFEKYATDPVQARDLLEALGERYWLANNRRAAAVVYERLSPERPDSRNLELWKARIAESRGRSRAR